jgi:hypothetical protein
MSFKSLFAYWTPYLTYVEVPNYVETAVLDLAEGHIDFVGPLLIEAPGPQEMGLFLEIKKSPGMRAQIRIVEPHRDLGTHPADMIECNPN